MDFSRDNTPLHKMTRGQRMRAIYGPDWREKVRDVPEKPKTPGVHAKGEVWIEAKDKHGHIKDRRYVQNTIDDDFYYQLAKYFGSWGVAQTTDMDELDYFDFYDDGDGDDWGHTADVTLNDGADLTDDFCEVVGTYTNSSGVAESITQSKLYSENDVEYSAVTFTAVALADGDTLTETWRITLATTEDAGMDIKDSFDALLAYGLAPGQGDNYATHWMTTDFNDGSWGNEAACTLTAGGTGTEVTATLSGVYTASASVTVTDVRLKHAGITYIEIDLGTYDTDKVMTSGQSYTVDWNITCAAA